VPDSKPTADAYGDRDEVDNDVLGPAWDALIETLGFVEEIGDIAGEGEGRAYLVGDPNVYGITIFPIKIQGRAGGGVARDMSARKVVENACTEATVAPAEADVGRFGNESGDFACFPNGRAPEVSFGLNDRVIGGAAQAFQEPGQEGELLLVAELPAFHHGIAGIACS